MLGHRSANGPSLRVALSLCVAATAVVGIVAADAGANGATGLPCTTPHGPYLARTATETYSRPGMSIHRWTAPGRTNLYVLKASTVGAKKVKIAPLPGVSVAQRSAVNSRLYHSRYGLAAINADFYFWGQSWTPWGPEVLNGVTRKGNASPQDALVQYRDGHVARTKVAMHQIIWTNGKVIGLDVMNSQNLPADGVGLYGPLWGNTSRLYLSGSSRAEEVFVSHDRITRINHEITTEPRPADGYVLVAQGDGVDRLNKLGPRVGLKIGKLMSAATDSTGRRVEEAVGIGLIVIANGDLHANAACVADRRVARTVLGIADGGKTLYVVVCEGIKDNQATGDAGMSLRETAGVMRSLGVRDAMMFDGGGSAEMSVRHAAHTWQMARSSDGWQRLVPSILGIFSQ